MKCRMPKAAYGKYSNEHREEVVRFITEEGLAPGSVSPRDSQTYSRELVKVKMARNTQKGRCVFCERIALKCVFIKRERLHCPVFGLFRLELVLWFYPKRLVLISFRAMLDWVLKFKSAIRKSERCMAPRGCSPI